MNYKVLIISFIEDIALRIHYTKNRNFFSVKRLNFIYKCTSCHRYHREYQRELIEDTCPHCLGPKFNRVKEEYKWMDYHNDCLALNYKIYKKHIVNKKKKEQREYDDRSIVEFLKKF